jgi:DNA-directed RNA polymerase sigma subunit (sigma70/sigma32)
MSLYGKLHVDANCAAYQIWLKRHEEPKPDEPAYTLGQLCDRTGEPAFSRDDVQNLLAKVSATWVSERDWQVLCLRTHGDTLDEVGQALGITRERVRQLETKALRRMRRGLQACNVKCVADVI